MYNKGEVERGGVVKNKELEKLYTVKEVAELLKLSERTIWQYIEDGKLKKKQIFSNVRIPESELKRIIK